MALQVFNWTWSYRRDSDIFEPVGYLRRRASPPSRDEMLEKTRRKKRGVAWIASHCGVQSKRDE